MRSQPRRLRGIALLSGGTVLAAVFGLGLQSLLSYHFGAGAETDAWFMSLSIYGFMAGFLMLTHLKSIALPVYQRLRKEDERRARRMIQDLLLVAGGGGVVIASLLVVGAPLIVDLLAPGYQGAMRSLTVHLVQIRVPGLVFLLVVTAGLIVLESGHRFGFSALAQKVAPAGVTLGLFAAFGAHFGVIGLGWMALTGGAAGMLVVVIAARPLLAGLRRSRGRYRVGSATELREIGGQWVRFGGSNAASLVGEWVFRISASLLPVGVFSAVVYGRMVHDLLHGAVNDSAQTVNLPRFASAMAGPDDRGDGESALARVGTELRHSLHVLATVNVPVAALVASVAPWIIALLFGRGQFLADGMVGPASLALRIYALGFLLQGLNQLIFAAAFASGRSYLVNRVQMAGHLVRAALLIPAVVHWSFVGLVGVQVFMNVLVLVMLLAAAPAPWKLGLRSLSHISRLTGIFAILVATGATWALYLMAPVWRIDPLSVGTGARIGVLIAVTLSWAIAYLVLASLLRVTPVASVWGRVRRALGGFGLFFLAAGRLHSVEAQELPQALVPGGHWSVDIIEIMEAQGVVGVGTARAGPLTASSVGTVLEAAESGVAWGRHALTSLRTELGANGAWTGSIEAGVSSSRVDEAHARSAPFASVEVRGGHEGGRVFGDARVTARGAGQGVALDWGGAGVRLGAFAVQVTRRRLQLGGGVSGAIVLSREASLDGVLMTTLDRPLLPIVGLTTITAGVFPLRHYPSVRNPWLGLMRVAVQPEPWLAVGLSRGAMVGGHFAGGTVAFDPVPYPPDDGSMSMGDLLGVLVGRNTRYDNQVTAVDLRMSLSALGPPVLLYGEIGLDDLARSWGDGAVVAGLLFSPRTHVPLSLRYEYTGIGRSGRWCPFCDTRPTYWYQHTRFQSGWTTGKGLLGHPLGGYGMEHLLSLVAADPDVRLRLRLTGGILRRDRWNLLEEERPGRAWYAGGTVSYRWSSAVEIGVRGRWETGASGWSVHDVAIRAALRV